MFEKWNLPTNICGLYTISRENLDFYVDRQDVSKDIQKSIQIGANCCVIEGDIGVGKTSIGNFARFSSGFFTPTLELKVRSSWSREDFLMALMVSIISELLRPGNTYKLEENKSLIPFYKKYLDYTSNGYTFNFTWSKLLGVGGGKSSSLSRAKLTEVQIENDLNLIANIIKNKLGQKNPIIIQLNNLDIGDGVTKDELKQLLNDIQEWFKNELFTWILTAKKGFSDFIRNEVPRMKQVISKTVFVEHMQFEDVKEVFRKRIYNEGYGGDIGLIFEDQLLKEIYESSNCILRDMLNTISDILMMYDDQKYISKIALNKDDVKACFKLKYIRELEELSKISNAVNTLKTISKYPGKNQTFLVKKTKGLVQKNASRLLSKLEEKGCIRIEKDKNNNKYFLNGEYVFVF